MERAESTALAGRGQVEIVRFAANRGRFERFDGGGDFGGREIFQFVKTLAEALFFFDRHFAKVGVLREGRDRAFATEVIDANLLDLLRRRRRLQILNEPFLNFLHGNLSQSIQTESRPSRRSRQSGGRRERSEILSKIVNLAEKASSKARLSDASTNVPLYYNVVFDLR